MRKTKKPTNTMPSATAVMNIRINMTVSTNVSTASNTTDGNGTMTSIMANGNISARIVWSDRNGK